MNSSVALAFPPFSNARWMIVFCSLCHPSNGLRMKHTLKNILKHFYYIISKVRRKKIKRGGKEKNVWQHYLNWHNCILRDVLSYALMRKCPIETKNTFITHVWSKLEITYASNLDYSQVFINSCIIMKI